MELCHVLSKLCSAYVTELHINMNQVNAYFVWVLCGDITCKREEDKCGTLSCNE